MTASGDSPRGDRARKAEAADWFARMRGPDAERDRLAFERWRAGDPRNRAAYARLEELWRASAGLAGTEMGRAPIFIRRRSLFALRGPRLAFASLAALAVAGTGAYLLVPRGGAPAPVVAEAQPSVSTGVGEIRAVRLADGSTVTLDTDSVIQVSMTAGARRVRLMRGRARFEVAHDAARPFTVEADGRTVTALGTVFDVAYGDKGVRVTLLRGSVEVRDGGGPASAKRLAVGQTLTAAPGRAPQVAAAQTGGERWVSGMLSFDGAPLSSVIDEANRYATHKLRLGDPKLATLRVSGVFKALPTDALAASLAAAFDLRLERAANGDFVLRAD